MAANAAEAAGNGTRERVFAVAERLFADKGYGSTSMREVARAAGIRESTLYHHCGSKDALYREVTGRMQRRIREVVEDALSQGGDLPARVCRAAEALFDFFLRYPHLAKLSVRSAIGDRLDQGDAGTRKWAGFIEQVLGSEGGGAVRGMDPALLLITLDGVMAYHLLAVQRRPAPEAEQFAERTRAHLIRVLLRILGLDAPKAARRRARS